MGKKKFLTREEQEATEGYKTQSVDVPGSRFQTEQQDVPATSAAKTKAESTGFGKKKTKAEGAVLKQEVAARVIDTGVGGEVPEAAAAVRGLSYSGNEGTILASAAYTPIAGQSRSDSRTGKKLDATAKKLNFVPSEQVEEVFDESKPLAENPSAVQGYNGSPRNTNARSQKNVGFAPSELLFQRSLDEIKRDQLYFSTGQVVKQMVNGIALDLADTPTIVPEKNASTGVYVYGNTPNYTLTRGNYLHRAMTIQFDSDGTLTKMVFDTVDVTAGSDNVYVINDASANATIDMNYAEMDRQNMDHKAGDEKAEIWTPLARAVKQPTRTVGYLRDIENITGAEVFMAYKKTALCHSYQLNRAAKDGMKLVTPMAEAALGLVHEEDSSLTFANYTTGNIFSTAEYVLGASSLFIAINDSIAKYNNKADLLVQPRSYKLALQVADNNMNPLRVKADFVQAVNSREVFSTIDREYDPLQPVCISDKEAIIHCYDFNDLYSFSSLDENGNPNFNKDPFIYAYSDLRNSYVVAAAIPLLRGLHQYLNSVGPKIVSLNNGALANTDIVIPMVHSTCFFSLWSLFILSATPFIDRERVNSLRDVLYYEKNVEYPFHQLISIRDANPMNGINYGNTDYQLPITVKRMMPSVALTWVLPEVFWPVDEQTTDDKYTYVLPWYFNQVEFNFTGTSIERADGKYAISMPSIRSGVRFGYLDDIYGMEERDVRLSLDRLVDIPVNTTSAGNQGVYKYSQNNDGIPYCTFTAANFTIKKFLSLPRELGWFLVAPAGVLGKMRTGNTTFGYATANGPMFGQSSYLAKYWHGRVPTTAAGSPSAILEKANINVSRSSAYKQDWDAIPATNKFDQGEADWGFYMSVADALGDGHTLVTGKSKFIPFTTGVVSGGAEGVKSDTDFEVMALHKALWTRIQKIPMALSPWDMRIKRGLTDDTIKFDPYDFLYYFGLAGFKASEYDEDVYNRCNDILDKGFSFLEDPFCQASPLFKEAGHATQSANNDSLVK